MPTTVAEPDIQASLAVLAAGGHAHGGMLKFPADLDRYTRIIADTRPELVIETGTLHGGSARWFADQGVQVVTVDRHAVIIPIDYRGRIVQVVGDSVDEAVVAAVAGHAEGKRVMVTLDSDHSAKHVAAEIAAYGPLVSPGCYLVVEDTLFHYAPENVRQAHGVCVGDAGTPMDAIAVLQRSRKWRRDREIEGMAPTTACPAGWWVRV